MDNHKGDKRKPLTKNKYIYVVNNPLNFVDPSGNWAATVHQQLTKDIIDSFTKSYGDTTFGEFLKEMKATIVYYSNGPDGKWRNITYQWADHFYNPDTKANYKGTDSSLGTAPGRVKEYMGYAKERYKKKDDAVIRPQCARDIAWALHYLEDMSNPYHTSDKTGLNSDHGDYEDWAENNITAKTVSVDTGSKAYYYIATTLATDSHDDAEGKWKKDTKYIGLYYLPKEKTDLNKYFDWARKKGTQLLYNFYDAVE